VTSDYIIATKTLDNIGDFDPIAAFLFLSSKSDVSPQFLSVVLSMKQPANVTARDVA
jgi:hypothetical protein